MSNNVQDMHTSLQCMSRAVAHITCVDAPYDVTKFLRLIGSILLRSLCLKKLFRFYLSQCNQTEEYALISSLSRAESDRFVAIHD